MNLKKILFFGISMFIGEKVGRAYGENLQKRISKKSPEEFELYKSREQKNKKIKKGIVRWLIWYFIIGTILIILAGLFTAIKDSLQKSETPFERQHNQKENKSANEVNY